MEQALEKEIDFVRPSSLERVWNCPGSHYMEKGMPDTTSEAAEEGTMLHAILADGIEKGVLDIENLTAEQVTTVMSCWDLLSCEKERFCNPDVVIDSEVTLVLNREDGSFLDKGTADVVIRDDNSVTVVDWKMGREEVTDACKNPQVAFYAAAAMQTYNVPKARAIIFQPRIGKMTEFTFTNLHSLIASIEAINDPAISTSGPLSLVPSEKTCRFCKAKTKCHAFARAFNSLVIAPDFSTMKPEELARFYEVGQMVKKWIETDLEKAMGAYLDEHGSLEGYEWKEIQGRREVTDIQSLADAVAELCTPEDFRDSCTVSLTKLYEKCESALQSIDKNNGGKGTKKDAKAAFESMSEPFVGRGKPSRRIVKNNKEN